jgi:hypothetical protein
MARFPFSPVSWTAAFVSSLAIFNTIIPVQAQSTTTDASTSAASSSTNPGSQTISGTNAEGVTQTLLVGRTPALYTGDFGDCMGGQSLLNLTSFDAAYYADNMTVIFNLAGTTNLRNETVMCEYIHWQIVPSKMLTSNLVYISVDACKTNCRLE